MGKLIIKGEANRKAEADTAKLTITFYAREKTAAQAVVGVMKNCESFLDTLKKWGMDISKLRMENDDIDRNRYDKETYATAKRKISFVSKRDMKFQNDIMQLIQKNEIDAELSVSYTNSKLQKIHEKLLKEAVENSRRKAELIASTTGQKIIGIDSVRTENTTGFYNDDDDEFEDDFEDDCIRKCCSVPKLLSDELGAPEQRISKSVDVVWLME